MDVNFPVPPAEMSLTTVYKLTLAKLFPAGESLVIVTSRLGTGKSTKFSYSVNYDLFVVSGLIYQWNKDNIRVYAAKSTYLLVTEDVFETGNESSSLRLRPAL
jgi:hypothetical protein